jgi:hypothetical protein
VQHQQGVRLRRRMHAASLVIPPSWPSPSSPPVPPKSPRRAEGGRFPEAVVSHSGQGQKKSLGLCQTCGIEEGDRVVRDGFGEGVVIWSCAGLPMRESGDRVEWTGEGDGVAWCSVGMRESPWWECASDGWDARHCAWRVSSIRLSCFAALPRARQVIMISSPTLATPPQGSHILCRHASSPSSSSSRASLSLSFLTSNASPRSPFSH